MEGNKVPISLEAFAIGHKGDSKTPSLLYSVIGLCQNLKQVKFLLKKYASLYLCFISWFTFISIFSLFLSIPSRCLSFSHFLLLFHSHSFSLSLHLHSLSLHVLKTAPHPLSFSLSFLFSLLFHVKFSFLIFPILDPHISLYVAEKTMSIPSPILNLLAFIIQHVVGKYAPGFSFKGPEY